VERVQAGFSTKDLRMRGAARRPPAHKLPRQQRGGHEEQPEYVWPIKIHGTKFQTPNSKSQSNLEAGKNSNKPRVFETSRLDFFWRLSIGVWDFGISSDRQLAARLSK
jgi:hypothetical protein